MLIHNERGLTTLEYLLLSAFVIAFFGILYTGSQFYSIKNTLNTASGNAARYAAANHSYGTNSEAWQKAVRTVKGTHNTEWSIGPGDSITPHKTFDPVNANPYTPDVMVEKIGDYAVATVNYHLPTPIPGLAKLLNPDADWLDSYIKISSQSSFKVE